MANTQTSNEQGNRIEQDPTAEIPSETRPDDEEFKITVKKLDVTVRPRGVLAE
jgi:hypothetical protein